MDIVSSIIKLHNIFFKKEWMGRDGHDIIFEKFCKLLSNLSEPQRKLIIELAERYTWITFKEYNNHLISVLHKIEDEKLKSLRRIILFPIMKPGDESATKSGHEVLYFVKALRPILRGYENITFTAVESFEEITADSFSVNDDETIFLLDDYLGSGETIKATLTEILKNKAIKPANLIVISISAQKESLDIINDFGILTYTAHLSQKGISDYYSSPILEEKTNIMKEIEQLIKVKKRFSFGYNSSEALITLMKTPNNTFPVFWKDYQKKGVIFEAPFSRY